MPPPHLAVAVREHHHELGGSDLLVAPLLGLLPVRSRPPSGSVVALLVLLLVLVLVGLLVA